MSTKEQLALQNIQAGQENVYHELRNGHTNGLPAVEDPPAYETLSNARKDEDYSELANVKKRASPPYRYFAFVSLILFCTAATAGIIYAIVWAASSDPPGTTVTTPINPTTSSIGPPTSTKAPPMGWSDWSSWSSCSATCDEGEQSRTRECVPSGTTCKGSDMQTRPCDDGKCPYPDYGEWSSWTGWTECTVTCGDDGVQFRTRVCDKEPEDLDCPGSNSQDRDCNKFDCPSCTDRTCPDGGIGDTGTDCMRCRCSGNDHTARVVTETFNPLRGVSISDTDFPNHILTTTDGEGYFTIDDACNGIILQFSRPDLVTATQELKTNLDTIFMEEIENLVILVHPEEKERLVGQSVKLCCEATGNPGPDYFEWFKDGAIIEGDSGTGDGQLVLNSISLDHDGYYQCRASNDYSSVKSDEARLQVEEDSSAFCSVTPGENIITLPPGCEQGDGSLEFDAGGCNPKPCPGSEEGTADDCTDVGKYCCGPTVIDRTDLQCRGFVLPVYLVTECGCIVCSDPVITILGFAIAADTNEPIAYPTVMVNGTEIIGGSNDKGEFTLEVPGNTKHLAMRVLDDSGIYADTNKVINFPDSPSTMLYIRIFLLPYNDERTVDSTKESVIPIGGNEPFGVVYIPSNSIYSLTGEVFSGSVRVTLSTVDPKNFSNILNSPGQFSTIDIDGNPQRLKTYGMFSMKLLDSTTGKQLQLKEKVQVALDASAVAGEVDPDGNLLAKLWSLNPTSGLWDLSGSMIPENSTYPRWRKDPSIFNANLFSDIIVGDTTISVQRTWTNFDGNDYRACYAKVRLFENNNFAENSQLTNGMVTLIAIDEGRSSATTVYGDVSSVRAKTDDGDKNGYCVIGLCDKSNNRQPYSGYIIAEHNNKRLFGAAESDNKIKIGIDDDTAEALNYKAVTDEGDYPGIETEFALSLIPSGKKGPLYDWTGSGGKGWELSSTCSGANFYENHYRFYKEDVFSDICTVPLYVVQEKVIEPPPEPPGRNWLAWFSKSTSNEYGVCYIKVLVKNGKEHTFGAISAVGNCTHPDGDAKVNDLYGVDSECTHSTGEEAICLEIKHPAPLTDAQSPPNTCLMDETVITISEIASEGNDIQCKRTGLSQGITFFGQKIIEKNDVSKLKMYYDPAAEGSLFGIYCHMQNNIKSADEPRAAAYQMCSNGGDNYLNLVDPMSINNENWAVKFDCS